MLNTITVNGTKFDFVGNSRGNRSGFVHYGELYVNNWKSTEYKIQYYNRTWESYQYQSLFRGLVYKAMNEYITERKNAYKYINNIERMTAKHKAIFETELEKDILLTAYKDLYKTL